ncbi:MAG: tetratricopeptide repeat protein [Verrucomicrobiae bacterium]|jgi:TolA-binding protein|nr:tetratricopeptide repeat protein [Verrucomicrobiae bacterium]
MKRLVLAVILLRAFASLLAQDGNPPPSPEQHEFNAALQAFEDGLMDHARAEAEFNAFLEKWPNSDLRQAAALYLARTHLLRGHHQRAVEILTSRLPDAGKWADRYQFWIGEAWFAAEEFERAALAYADMLATHRDSDLRFRAAYNEALSRLRLRQYGDVRSLLENPAGPFQQGVALFPNDPLVSSGHLLLAETRLEVNDPAGAQDALNNLKGWELDAMQKWQRQYLLCRLARITGEPEAALTATTNLLSLAEPIGLPTARARTFHLQAGILEQLGRPDDALAVLKNNLSPSTPPSLKREALLKVVDLNVERGRLAVAVETLDHYSANHTNDPALPLAWRTVGELRLRSFHELDSNQRASDAATNVIRQAVANFSSSLKFGSAQHGSTSFYRGWCHWYLGDWGNAALDFESATERLPFSQQQAIARFKLAECQLRLGDTTNAVSTLSNLIQHYRQSARLRNGLLDGALYTLLRASVIVGDLEQAEESVQHILSWYGDSFFGDRSLLFYGQALNQHGHPSDARAAFEELLARFPDSKLAPRVQMAIARTFEKERNWSAAAFQLQTWAGRFPKDPMLADVEYERAWLTHQSGSSDHAFQLYTNFVHRFPKHANAPLAEKWVADYFFNQGLFVKAQETYQTLYEKPDWGNERLKYESRIAAGRAALAGGLINEATNSFLSLARDDSCPLDLQPEIWFALGDSFSVAQHHDLAINAFNRITNFFSGSRLVPYALGRIGDSHLQLARTDGKRLDSADIAYRLALKHPGAEAPARTLAEFGLAQVAEHRRLTNDAINHYSNILYRKNLKPDDPVDFHSIKESGYAIARLLENGGDMEGALKILNRVTDNFPSLKPVLTPRIERLESKLRKP